MGLQEPHQRNVPRMWGSHLPLSPQLLCVGATVNSCAKASRWPWAQVCGGRGFWHLKKVSGKGRKVSKATGWRKNTHREGFGMMIWWLFFGVRGTIVSWKEKKHSQLFPTICCDTFWGKLNNSFKQMTSHFTWWSFIRLLFFLKHHTPKQMTWQVRWWYIYIYLPTHILLNPWVVASLVVIFCSISQVGTWMAQRHPKFGENPQNFSLSGWWQLKYFGHFHP